MDRSIGSLKGVNPGSKRPVGAFEIFPLGGGTSEYPILWKHDAPSGRESAMRVEPDHEGIPRPERRDKAVELWKTATRLHINRDFRLTSQPLAACRTPRPVLGGRAWPSFKLEELRDEPILCVWLNSTLGLLCRWLVSSRQQPGKAILTVSTLKHIPVLDPAALTVEQRNAFAVLYRRFELRLLLPANEAYHDTQRRLLDRWVLRILGLDAPAEARGLRLLRRQWCEEPSVHGGKRTRP